MRRPTYAALDLGTNNCRLLVARPTGDGFRVIDAFSRIIRLGEGVSASGRISDAAIEPRGRRARHLPRQDAQSRRDAGAADRDRGVPRSGERRRIPCAHRRGGRTRARNHRPRDRSDAGGHRLHAADRSRNADGVLLFDIGGGSSELVRLERSPPTQRGPPLPHDQGLGVAAGRAWSRSPSATAVTSVTPEIYEAMIAEVAASARPLRGRAWRRSVDRSPSARHLRDGDDDRRRASRAPALRAPPGRRLLDGRRRGDPRDRAACSP